MKKRGFGGGDYQDLMKAVDYVLKNYDFIDEKRLGVENVETLLLILHSEKDYRCPIEQAEQLFIALKRLGKNTKFIRFPEENHELSRSGKPELRITRLNYIVN